LNKYEKVIREFERKNAALTKRASDALIDRIGIKTDARQVGKIVDQVLSQYKVEANVKAALMDSIASSVTVVVGAGTLSAPKVALLKRWFLDKAYSPSGSKLSKELYSLVDRKEITRILSKSLRANDTWREAAQRLSDTRIPRADVAKDVQAIIDRARSAYKLSGDVEGYREYKAAVKRVQSRIDKLVDQDTSKLKRAYQDVLDLTMESSEAQIANAVKYASYFKQRYNAETIARTETAKAYGDASFADALYDEDAIGVQFTLSDAHDIDDICDMICGADMFGMGEGVYPKDNAPQYPFHPNCACGITKHFPRSQFDEQKKPKFNSAPIKKYIEGASPSVKKQILDNMGARSVPKSAPSAWDKKPVIPKNVLYGEK
jgi:hypothetical protein